MTFDDIGLLIAAAMVVVGVLLEGAEYLDDLRKKGWRPITPKIGFAILVIGLAFETVFEARIGQDAANTRLRAGQAELALEKIKMPRSLTAHQENEIVKALKPFAQMEVDVCVYPDDPEIVGITNQVMDVLKRAGWIPYLYFVTEYTRSVSGMLAETDPGDAKAMTALVNVLRAQNLSVDGPIPSVRIGQDNSGLWATYVPGPGTKGDWIQNPVGFLTPGFWVIIGERLTIGKKSQ